MFKKFITLLFIISTQAFTYYNVNPVSNIKLLQHTTCPTYLKKYTSVFNQEQGEFIIKKISSIFPQVDSISHIVLHNSDNLINCALNNHLLSTETKKIIVLFIVQFIQFGDSTGGYILDFYNQLVNCLL